MSALGITAVRVLWVLALAVPLLSQSILFKLQPDAAYSQPVASAQACYANCQSCQTASNQCEECFSPYFIKAQDGSCSIADHYTVLPPSRRSSPPPTNSGRAPLSSTRGSPGARRSRPTARLALSS